MKHPIKLIILFILSGTNAVYNLISSYFKYETLEEDVAMIMTNMYKSMPDLDPEELPEFVLTDVTSSLVHYMEYGVMHYYIEFWSHAIAFTGILLMAAFKKSGFTIYVIGALLGFSAIFLGFGFNRCTCILALCYALISLIFIKLYQIWFLKNNGI